jgi:nickel/cobalt exporter
MTTDLLLGSLVLSLLHAAIPNHWLPIVAIGKRAGWSAAEKLRVLPFGQAALTRSARC